MNDDNMTFNRADTETKGNKTGELPFLNNAMATSQTDNLPGDAPILSATAISTIPSDSQASILHQNQHHSEDQFIESGDALSRSSFTNTDGRSPSVAPNKSSCRSSPSPSDRINRGIENNEPYETVDYGGEFHSMPQIIHDILERGRPTTSNGNAADEFSAASISGSFSAISYSLSEKAIDGSVANISETKSITSRISHGDKTVKMRNFDPIRSNTMRTNNSFKIHRKNHSLSQIKDTEPGDGESTANSDIIMTETVKENYDLCGKRTKRLIIIGLVIVFFFGIVTLVFSIIMSARSTYPTSSTIDQSALKQSRTKPDSDQSTFPFLDTSPPSSLLPKQQSDTEERFVTTTASSVSISKSNQTSGINFSNKEKITSEAIISSLTSSDTVSSMKITSSSSRNDTINSPISAQASMTIMKSSEPMESATIGASISVPHAIEFDTNSIRFELLDTIRGSQPHETFGYATALSTNGNILLIGSPHASFNEKERVGRIAIFEKQYTNEINNNDAVKWIQRGSSIHGSNMMDQLGFAVACNEDGSMIVASEPKFGVDQRGRIRIFEWNSEISVYEQKFEIEGDEVSSHFGVSLSITPDSRRLVIGSPYHSLGGTRRLSGQVRVYERKYIEAETKTFFNDEETIDGMHRWEMVGEPLQGAYSADWFGWAVEISRDGNILIAGAPRNKDYGGYVRCFIFDKKNDGNINSSGGKWIQVGRDIINEIYPANTKDLFGHAISLDYDNSLNKLWIAVGAPWKDVNDEDNSGLVTVYKYDVGRIDGSTFGFGLDSEWELLGRPLEIEPSSSDKAGTIASDQQFGYSLKLLSNLLIVGSPGANSRRGEVLVYILATNEIEGESEWMKSPSNAMIGSKEGDDYGFSLSVAYDDDNNTPGSIICAVGAVMLRSDDPDSNSGHVKILRS